ncbi:unnamed protein product, partial [Pylaiella littoralis]
EAFDVEAIYGKNVPGRRDFIIVEFNAWEYTGSEVLWAALITKIFDQVEGHAAFGRGVVRAARIMRVLRDPSWNWFGLVLFYTMFALLGLAVVALTSTVGAIDHAVRWTAAAVVFPGGLTLLNFLHQMHSRGSFGTAQSVLR